jgi:anti-sigma regulatory factor (Ser/Thr protein kinase)
MTPDSRPFSRLDLACEPSSIRYARRHAEDTLERWGVPEETVCDALTIVSELATNAVRHTGPSIEPSAPSGGQSEVRQCSLMLWTAASRLYVSVWDENPAPPVLRAVSDYAETGRGLQLVSTLSGGSWGYEQTPERPGKRVWAALRLPPDGDTALSSAAVPLGGAPQELGPVTEVWPSIGAVSA